MSLNYTTWFNSIFNTVAAFSTGNGSSATDPIWAQEIPNLIDYAEQRIFRDLDLLATRVTDQSAVLTPNGRVFTLPTTIGTFIVPEYFNVILPASANFVTGVRVPLVPVSRAYMDFAWPSASSGTGPPQVYAPRDNASIFLGPTPDQAYPIEVTGTQRPIPLSASNSSTFLTTQLPDLWFCATMVKASAFMRDFGQQADNPAMSVSWEGQYQGLLKSADTEEAKKFLRSAGWTAQGVRAVSAPQRVQ